MVRTSRLGLKGRALTFSVLLLAGTVVVLSTALVWQYYSNAMREMTAKVLVHAGSTGQIAEPYVQLNDLAALQRLLRASGSLEELKVARIQDRSGKVLAEFRRENHQHEAFPRSFEAGGSLPGQTLVVERSGHVFLAVPVWPEQDDLDLGLVEETPRRQPDEPIGVLQAIYSLDAVHAALRRYILACVTIAVAVMAVGVAVTILVVRQLLKPVEVLARTSSAIARGDFSQRAPEEAIGEIGDLARSFNHMARTIQNYTQVLEAQVAERTAALAESEAQTRAILDTAADGIITIDGDGRISSFNDAAEQIFGYTAAEILGRDPRVLLGETADGGGDLPVFGVSGRQGGGTDGRRQMEGRRKDGSRFPMELAVSEVMLSNRRTHTVIVRDVTERCQAESRIRQTVEELERFNRLAVGRELRMIELKREINQLAERAGLRPPYDLSFVDTGTLGACELLKA